jgi:hypothetical protein
VAFFNSSNSTKSSGEFHSRARFNRLILNSSTFLAVMWTSNEPNQGTFEFHAKCHNQTTSAVEGSGGELLQTFSTQG